jgi:hypothetical protein
LLSNRVGSDATIKATDTYLVGQQYNTAASFLNRGGRPEKLHGNQIQQRADDVVQRWTWLSAD